MVDHTTHKARSAVSADQTGAIAKLQYNYALQKDKGPKQSIYMYNYSLYIIIITQGRWVWGHKGLFYFISCIHGKKKKKK